MKPLFFLLLLISSALPVSRATSTVLASFLGIGSQETDVSSPDCHGAVGPRGVLQIVNTRIAYADKTGRRIWAEAQEGFWPSGSYGFQSKAIYDEVTGRFFVVTGTAANFLKNFYLEIAVSLDSNPTTASSWSFYAVDLTATTAGTLRGASGPALGMDRQAIYVTFDRYEALGDDIKGAPPAVDIVALDKQALIADKLIYRRRTARNGPIGHLTPVTVVGLASPGNRAYFINAPSPSALYLWTLEDPLGLAELSLPASLSVPLNWAEPAHATINGKTLLRTSGRGNAFWRDGSLWFCFTGGELITGRSRIHYYRIDTSGSLGRPSVAIPNGEDPGYIDGRPDAWNYVPAISGNKYGDICVVFNQDTLDNFARMMCAIRPRNASRFDAPFLIRDRDEFGGVFYSCKDEYENICWSDTAVVCVDPEDQSFWLSHQCELIGVKQGWLAWWARVAATAPFSPLRHWYVDSQPCLFRTGAPQCQTLPPVGPFEHLRDGVLQAGYGDSVHLHGARYKTPLILSKPMIFRAYEGNALLGR